MATVKSHTPKRLYTDQPGTSVETLYTVPTDTTTIVKNIVLSNTTGADETITIHFVPSGGTADATNQIVSNSAIGANDTVTIDLSGVLEVGDTIQAVQVTSGAITAYISGVEVA